MSPAPATAPAAPAPRRSASPDQLDRLLTLIRPQLWIVLAALLVLVGLTVAWGFLATVRETVPSRGIVQRGSGLLTLQAPAEGRLTAVAAATGATVHQGDALATVTGANGVVTVLRAPIDGRVIDAVAGDGAVVTLGEQLFSLEPTTGAMAVTVVVAADHRSEIHVGDPVQVHPYGASDAQLGYVHGQVSSIDPYPADGDELTRDFGSSRVVGFVAGNAAVYVVRVKLLTDRSGPNGLKWSTPTGSGASIHTGQLTDASIVVSQGSIAKRVFP
jgi:biotin carboxyl carrier protein